MSDVTSTVDTYFAMWNETDATRRAAHTERAWASDGAYVDPLLEAKGHAAISEMAVAVHKQFPGFRFRRTTGIDTHHNQVRFGWELAGPDGTIAVAGIDVGELAADGRFTRITGFFGDLPKES